MAAEGDPPRNRRKERGPTSRDLQRENTKARIIQSALGVFASKGFEGGGTREIAAGAGVRQALLTHYFGSKLELWKAVISSLFAESEERLVQSGVRDETRPLEERVKAMIRTYARFTADHPEHGRLMQQVAMHGGPQLEWLDETFSRGRADTALTFFKDAIAAGILPDVDPRLLFFTLNGAVQSLYLLEAEARSLMGLEARSAEVVERHCEALFTIFLRSPARKHRPKGHGTA